MLITLTTNAVVPSVTTTEPEIREQYYQSYIWDLKIKWHTVQIPTNQTQLLTA
jgi:hypothetical protein